MEGLWRHGKAVETGELILSSSEISSCVFQLGRNEMQCEIYIWSLIFRLSDHSMPCADNENTLCPARPRLKVTQNQPQRAFHQVTTFSKGSRHCACTCTCWNTGFCCRDFSALIEFAKICVPQVCDGPRDLFHWLLLA
jgi:hypothetical protein